MSETPMISPAWIAVDWGTSNLRVYAMSRSGDLLDARSSDQGMSSLDANGYEAALRKLITGWDLPKPCKVIACGMVGSRQGWQEAPYRTVPCPAKTDAPVRVAACSDDLQIWLVPGIKQTTPPDVMRGEETQIAGFLSLNPDWDGVLCLPGTHSKWAHVSAGEIVSFRTFMTGELFDTISTGTVLRHSVKSTSFEPEAFDTACADTLSRPETLAAKLFSLRAADLLEGQSPARSRATLSGALIGMELAASKPYWLGQRIAVIGSSALVDLYERALSSQAVQIERCDADEVTRAGLTSIYSTL